MTAWSWVRWKNLFVWHVLESATRTVCGLILLPQATVFRHRGPKPPAWKRACAVCERKKTTQVQIPLPGEVRPR